MESKQIATSTGWISRRSVLRGLAGFLVGVGLEGCAQSLSSTPTVVPTTTSHPYGTVYYTYRGHADRIPSVAWSPDGKLIASGSLDRTAHIWAVNPVDHFHPVMYRGHTAGVQAVSWSPKGKHVASGSLDKTVQIWNPMSGEQIAVYRGHTDTVETLAWSPDGNFIASGSADGTVRLWDVASGQQRYVNHGHTGKVHTLAWSPDGRQIVSGASDRTVQIMDATNGNEIFTYRGHTGEVSSVSWSPDGKLIASGSWDKTVQVWDAVTGSLNYTYNGYNVQAARANPAAGVLPDLIFDVAWSHSGKRLLAVTQVYCGDICGIVISWDAHTRQNVSFFVDQPIFSIAWSPDDTRLAISIVVSTQGIEGTGSSPNDGAFVQISQA